MGRAARHVTSHGSFSDVGTKYGTLNQDFVLLEKLEACINYNAEGEGPNLPIYISVVLDGHGLLGEVSAQLAGRAAVRFLLRELSKLPGLADASVRELQDLFRRAFIQAHLASLKVYDSPPEVYSFPKGSPTCSHFSLNMRRGKPYYRSREGDIVRLECGTTCTACVLQGDVAVLANVGDSTVVVGFEDDKMQDYDGEAVTRNHNLKDAEELARCSAIPGVSITEDHYLHVEPSSSESVGHCAELHRGCMYRAVLATAHKCFNASLQLEPRHCCLIAASDGVWDHLTPREAVQIVMEQMDNGLDAKSASRELTRYAVEAALANGEADNATAVVYFLDF